MIFNIALSKVLYEVARFGDKSVIGVLSVLTIIYGEGLDLLFLDGRELLILGASTYF